MNIFIKILYKLITTFKKRSEISSKNYSVNSPKIISFDDNGIEKEITNFPNLLINFSGDCSQNIIKIHKNANFKRPFNMHFVKNVKNTEIKIDKITVTTGATANIYYDNCSLVINKNTTIVNAYFQLHEENAKIEIQEDCLIASNVYFWPSDAHAIFDKNTKKLLNKAKNPIIIGKHCWIGQNSIITKNVTIADDCIIGAGSIITKKFKNSNTIIAGNPAKEIKHDVNWSMESPTNYIEKNI